MVAAVDAVEARRYGWQPERGRCDVRPSREQREVIAARPCQTEGDLVLPD
jgi:hypothetical protein